ncbi:hypothetical protein GCM10027614_74420 [Micromonospora vulcania]
MQLSSHEPSLIEPYTSSVETCTTRPTPLRAQAARRWCEPITLVSKNGAGSSMDRSTCDSAAKCTTASCPGTTSASNCRSQMSPRTKVSRGCVAGRLVRSLA